MGRALVVLVCVFACHREAKPPGAEVPSGEVWLSPEQMKSSQISVAPIRERIGPELTTAGRVVGSIDSVWVLADVLEADLARVLPGAPVTVSVVAVPDKKFHGRVDWISGALDPASHTLRVRCSIRNPDHQLRPEMYAAVGIGVPGETALAVPRSAVVRAGDQLVAFVETGVTESGMLRFARRPVRVGESVSGDLLPVISGISAGETVVVEGAGRLLGLD